MKHKQRKEKRRTSSASQLPDDVKNVMNATAFVFKISIYDLFRPIRERHIVDARHVAISIIHESYGAYGKTKGYTLKQIGDFFNRDHTTVIHAIENCKTLCQVDDDYFAKYQEVLRLSSINGLRQSIPTVFGMYERLNDTNAKKACEFIEELLELQQIEQAAEQFPVIPKKAELLTSVNIVTNET